MWDQQVHAPHAMCSTVPMGFWEMNSVTAAHQVTSLPDHVAPKLLKPAKMTKERIFLPSP